MSRVRQVSKNRENQFMAIAAQSIPWSSDSVVPTASLLRRMSPVQPQGVLKGLNTSFAAAMLHGPRETSRMTTERKEGRFQREIGSHLFRPMTRAKLSSLLGIRNPLILPTRMLSSNGPYLASSVASSQGSRGKFAQATVQHSHEITWTSFPKLRFATPLR